MAIVFRTGFGSKADAQAVHQAPIRKLVQHLDSNCKTLSAGDVARRAEMVDILQATVDKLLEVDGYILADRPAFGVDV